MNLRLYHVGEMTNAEYLTKSVLAVLGVDSAEWQSWKPTVLKIADVLSHNEVKEAEPQDGRKEGEL
jgi:hypothetical protein